METIRTGVMVLLFCSVCGMLLGFLLPEGGVSRTVRSLIGVVILSAVCAPLFGVLGSWGGPVPQNALSGTFGERDTSVPYDVYREKTEAAVRDFCEEIVKRHTNVPRTISVDAHISEDGVIRIEHVRIVFTAQPEGRSAIENECAEEFGIIPEIRVEQEND